MENQRELGEWFFVPMQPPGRAGKAGFCPACGSDYFIPRIYGRLDYQGRERVMHGKAFHKGCVRIVWMDENGHEHSGGPEQQCLSCGYEW